MYFFLISILGHNTYLFLLNRTNLYMHRRLCKEKLGLQEYEVLLIYCKESKFMNCNRVETSPSISKSNEERAAAIKAPKKLNDLGTRILHRHTNFQQLAR